MQHYTRSHRSAAEVIAAAAAGDQRSWDQLVDQYARLLWAVARAYRLAGFDADDAIQGTWLRLIEHLPKIRKPERLGAWLATTMRRECIRVLERNGRAVPTEDVAELAGLELSDIDAQLLRDERDALLWRVFRRLSASDQRLLLLLSVEPALSYEEIAAALNMPIGGIGPTRARALERMRRALRTAEARALADSLE